MTYTSYESALHQWIQKESAALELMKIAGHLWLEKSVELVLLRRRIFDNKISEILNDHQYVQRYLGQPIDIEITLHLAQEIAKLPLPPARIDIARIASEYIHAGTTATPIHVFLEHQLKHILENREFQLQPKDVVLYGFGRIGRLAARILISENGRGQQLRLKGIVTRSGDEKDLLKRANLLRKDSVHGKMQGTIVEDAANNALIINGQTVKMIGADKPSNIDYGAFDISNALVIDNTGVWRDREGLSQHLLSSGVDKVLLTAPGKGDIPNIVYGVNHQVTGYKEQRIISAASCTTNAIIPVLDVVESVFGIERGHIETVHSYTNDQNLLDNYHKKFRRGKSAPLNMVITETGAASAVAKVLPYLKDKLTGNAVRVPTPNVSLAILNLTLKKQTSVDEINASLKEASLYGNLVEQIDFSISNELVSTDVIGNPHASVVDAPATIVSQDGRGVVLYVWYDNEFGYTKQVIRLAKFLSNVIRLTYY